jgi:DNA polymerase III subunit beta
MEFTVSQNSLKEELGFVQGIVERKNTIPVLSNIVIESVGENAIRFLGTDLDVTIRCETEADIKTGGAICVQARKLFEIVSRLSDAPVRFKRDENDWVKVECGKYNGRLAGVPREQFPEVPSFKSASLQLPAELFRSFIRHTSFAITQEQSRFTLNGAKFILNKDGAKMVTTDGHRLALIETANIGGGKPEAEIDVLIPKKTLSELLKLAEKHEGDIAFGEDANHLYFEVGSRLLISRKLTGQFPNYEMVLPKNNDKTANFDAQEFNSALARVRATADDRTKAVRMEFSDGAVKLGASSSEEGEGSEDVATDYTGEEVVVGFNAQYIQDFFNVMRDGKFAFEFKDGNAQAQMRPVTEEANYDYKYIVMPMRV